MESESKRRKGGGGLAFVITPTMDHLLSSSKPGYHGIFNEYPWSHVFAVELDTMKNDEFNDVDDNHVGIDINSVVSSNSTTAMYRNGTQNYQRLDLMSGKRTLVSIEYHGVSRTIQVTVSPYLYPNPEPILSTRFDLSTIFMKEMYIGFLTDFSGFSYTSYILGWSFAMNQKARDLSYTGIPSVPPMKVSRKVFLIVVHVIPMVSLLLVGSVLAYYVYRKLKFSEIVESWEGELNYISHRFKYKDLYTATKGFSRENLLGIGGFGQVFKGVMMSHPNIEVALKKISHDSRQGMKEFVAEIVSLGRLRHRNLVPLLGYCQRKGELILVYEYMSNGSLDKFLHGQPSFKLSWDQRYRIIRGVACGLAYLHEEWEQVVIHRDIKPANVLLDKEMNPRLGDFGLARLHAHGTDLSSSTTNIVGTIGYLAPEHTKTGKATKSVDIYALGALMLEVASGRKPIQFNADKEEIILVDWIHSLWNLNQLLIAIDPKLSGEYCKKEAELVLKLGLICCHARHYIRPNVRAIVGYLDDPSTFPEEQCCQALEFWVSDDHHLSMVSSEKLSTSGNLSISHSLFVGGR